MIDTNIIRKRIYSDNVSNEDIFKLCDEIDRLRCENIFKRSLRIRFPLVIDEFRNWSVSGWNGAKDSDMKDGLYDSMEGATQIYWITVTVPIPEEGKVEGEIENE